MIEKELAKLDGQMTLLEQQRLVIQTSHGDVEYVKVIEMSQTVVERMNKEVSVERIETQIERMQEQSQEIEERNELFINAGKINGIEEEDLW